MHPLVFELAPLLQVEVLPDGRVARGSRAFAERFGRPEGQLVSELLGGLAPGLRAALDRLVSTGQPFELPDIPLGGEGPGRVADARGVPLDGGGSLVVLVDVTRRAADALERTKRERADALARFAGGLAHDLNNLFSAISATAEAASADLADGVGDLRADLSAIATDVTRGSALSQALRAIAFDGSTSFRPVSLAAEVRAVAAQLGRAAGGATLNIDLDPETPDVVADRARIGQLVRHLLENARDASLAHEAPVDVWVRPGADGGAVLTVADRGAGVPSELRELIFLPYFTTKRAGLDAAPVSRGGVGLGLAIVDAVARGSGGSVDVTDRPGGGAEFRVVWPVTAVVPAMGDAPCSAAPQPGPPALVLLADNEVALVGAVARQLRRSGHSVYAAMSAAECRRLFGEYREALDVAVLDVRLGDGDGRELAAEFLEQRPELGIVLVSASRAALGVRPPGVTALVKPFEVEDLVRAIDEARRERRPVSSARLVGASGPPSA